MCETSSTGSNRPGPISRSNRIDGKNIAWRGDAIFQIDVEQFEELGALAGESNDIDARIRLLTEAADCYQGDLLPNCFADWALAEREQLRGKYASVLEHLVDALLDQRHNEEALQYAKALQRFDPLHESAYRRLMQTYAALGDRAAALRVYHTCASTLEQELGVEPSPATEALRTRLLHLEAQATVPDAPDMPQAVQRQRLVGRHDEWRQLQDVWRHVQQGAAKCFLLWGEAGIGKTRLAEELLDWAQHQSQTTASSRSYAVEGALTYAPIAEWLRAPAIRPALEQIDDLWRVEIARLLPELLADRPDLPQPGPMTETWQQQRFFQSIVHALKAAPAPLLLHLDDLQWSDAETLTLLQFLLHGARTHPLLFVGGIRTEDAGGNQALAAFIEAMRHSGQLIELFLGPLSADEAEQLAIQTAGKAIDSDVVDALFAASEGHPLYLIEAVRSEQGAPASSTKQTTPAPGRHNTSEMPDRIYNLLSARLDQLSPTALQVASLAAVIGHAFSYDVLKAASSVDELSLIDALDELWSRRLIREQPDDAYDFSHDRIREVAYLEISRARRRLFHRQVAAAMAAVYGDHLDEVAGELAGHYAQAGDSPSAYFFYRQAANVAVTQRALAHAEEMLDAALQHVPADPRERFDLLYQQNVVLRQSLQSGRWWENLDAMQALLTEIDPLPQEMQLVYLLDRSRYYDTLGYGQQGVESSKAALAVAEKLGDEQAIAQAYDFLASSYWKAGMMAEASPAFERAGHHARAIGDQVLEARTLSARARNGVFTDMPSTEIHGLLVRMRELAVATDSDELMLDSLGKLGYLRLTVGMGDFDLAQRDLERVIDLAQEIGKAGDLVLRYGNLGLLHTHKGDYRKALTALANSRHAAEESSTFFVYWVNVGRLGRVWMEMGRLEAAGASYREASEMLRQQGVRHYDAQVRCELGMLHLLAGDCPQAESELRAVLRFAEENGDLRLTALASTRLGYVLETTEQLEDAAKLYARCLDLHHRMEQYYYAMNARAGLARISILQGDDQAALEHVAAIWETIGGKEMDATIETARTLRTCYTIFEAHDDPRALAVLEMALDQLDRRASTIDDPEYVAQFWQLDDHRVFQKAAASVAKDR